MSHRLENQRSFVRQDLLYYRGATRLKDTPAHQFLRHTVSIFLVEVVASFHFLTRFVTNEKRSIQYVDDTSGYYIVFDVSVSRSRWPAPRYSCFFQKTCHGHSGRPVVWFTPSLLACTICVARQLPARGLRDSALAGHTVRPKITQTTRQTISLHFCFLLLK